MAVSKRKNRVGITTGYQVTVQAPDPRIGKNRRVVIGTYLRRKEADAAERKAKITVDAGTFEFQPPLPQKVVTVEAACDIWFQTKSATIQANSATGYKSAIVNHISPAFGDRDIATLTHDEIQAQVNSWYGAKGEDEKPTIGPRLIARCVMVLKAALDRQVKNGTLPFNPAVGIEKPSARTRKEIKIWTDAEVGRFLAAAEQDRQSPFWFLTLLEGMRRGEALGLRWSDLQWSNDEQTCIARISQTIVPDLANGGKALIQVRAKTTSSRRAVQLTQPTIRVLQAHRDRQKLERQALDDLWTAGDLIVTTTIGSVVTPSSIKRDLAELIREANVEKVTTHGLRHMSATTMLKAGISPAIVQQKLGHASIQTTVDAYGHLNVSDQAAANAALEAAVERAIGSGS